MDKEFIQGWVGPDHTRVYQDKNGNLTIKNGGSRSWRNNNPGNLIYGDFAKRHGAIGADREKPPGFPKAIFPTMEKGRQAREALLKTKTYQELTFREAVTKYAPPTENDTESYIKFLKQKTGITDDKVPFNTLTQQQIKALHAGIQTREHMQLGTENRISVDAPDYSKYKDWQPFDGSLLKRPVDSLNQGDINALMRSAAYQNARDPQHKLVQEVVKKWFEAAHPSESQKEKGTSVSSSKYSTLEKVQKSGQHAGSVHVNAYDRSGMSGPVHVDSYTRSWPSDHN